MKKILQQLSVVHWHWIIIGAVGFALWLFINKRSGIRGPLAPAVFTITQGCMSAVLISLLLVFAPKHVPGVANHKTVVFSAGIIGLTVLILLPMWARTLGPKIHLEWTMWAAVAGFVGMYCILGELGRLQGFEAGLRVYGLTIIATTGLEVVAQVACHFFLDYTGSEYEPWSERFTLKQVFGIAFILVGITLAFQTKKTQTPAEKPIAFIPQIVEVSVK